MVNCGQDLRQFPMQPECWWPLFAPTRGLHSMPLYAHYWEPLSQAKGQTAPTGNDHLEFPHGDLQPPDEEDLSEIDEPTVGPTSGTLYNGTELSLSSQRQNR